MAESPGWRERTRAEIAFLLRVLGLRRGARVLDLACGTGRHALGLARSGYAVTGLDISPVYLASARALARRSGARVRWLRGDMRRLDFREEFDAAVNLFTSFGYFPRPAEDLRILRGVARALKPGGMFVLDTINGVRIARNLMLCAKNGIPVQLWAEFPGGLCVLEEPELAPGRRAVRTRWVFLERGRREEMSSVIRLFGPDELARLCRKAGLRVERVLGDMSGAPYERLRSPRLILLARRPR